METLKQLLDKIYITSILCELSYNYYNRINNFVMLPTILGSSILTVLNSSDIDTNKMKIINITINGLNTLILAISTNYKLIDRINNYKVNRIKAIKLQHIIESFVMKNETITPTILEGFVNEYDKLYEDLVYGFPNHIKKEVVNKYQNTKSLPNSLSFLATNVDNNTTVNIVTID
jgi:hypothetical protein